MIVEREIPFATRELIDCVTRLTPIERRLTPPNDIGMTVDVIVILVRFYE